MTSYFLRVSGVFLLLLGLAACAPPEKPGSVPIRNGQGSIYWNQPVNNDLVRYTDVSFGLFEASSDKPISPALLENLNNKVLSELNNYKPKARTNKLLILKGRVIEQDTGGLFNSLKVKVKLRDAETGASLGEAEVIGKAHHEEPMQEVIADVAKGVAQLLGWH